MKHNYEVRKTALFPYYKYKQDAYKKLKEVVATLLAENDYFLGLRKYLTPKEHDLVSKCLTTFFKHKGDRTIVGYLESRIDYWEVNEDYCEFIAGEFRYLNKD